MAEDEGSQVAMSLRKAVVSARPRETVSAQ